MTLAQKKILDDEFRYQKWCKFQVFLVAFAPGWIGIIGFAFAVFLYSRGCFK